jgi:hypothetical protein
MTVSFPEALRRAASRKVWLTDDEFRMLHEADAANPPAADHRLQVDGLDVQSQTKKLERLWVG